LDDKEEAGTDPSAKPVPFKHYQANKVFMRSMVVSMVLQQIAVVLYISAYSSLTNYQTYFAFAKYDIPDGVEYSKWNQRFQIIHEVGSLPGIVLGSILMQRHRLLPFYCVTIFLGIAVTVQMISQFWAFILGRMISGISMGMANMALQRIIEEYSPMQSF